MRQSVSVCLPPNSLSHIHTNMVCLYVAEGGGGVKNHLSEKKIKVVTPFHTRFPETN